MKRFIPRPKLIALAATLAIAATVGAVMAADNNVGGVPAALNDVSKSLNAVLATVNSLATKITDLASKITELTTAVDKPSATSKVIATGVLREQGHGSACVVANLGTTPAAIKLTVHGANGQLAEPPLVITIAPGGTGGIENPVSPSSLVYCRIESEQVAQLRGTAWVRGINGFPVQTSDAR